MNLYRVQLKNPKFSALVVSDNPNDAYLKYKKLLDEKNYGFTNERALVNITLVAEEKFYNNSELLILQEQKEPVE